MAHAGARRQLVAKEDGFESIIHYERGLKHRHRAYGPDGPMRRERDLPLVVTAGWHPYSPVKLAFDGPSVVLVGGQTLRRVIIEPDGSVHSLEVAASPHEHGFGSIWAPVHSRQGFGVRFMGPGFAWFDDEAAVVDAFTLEGTEARSTVDAPSIPLGVEGLTVTGLAAFDGGYRAVLDRIPPRGEPKSKELVIVGRDLVR